MANSDIWYPAARAGVRPEAVVRTCKSDASTARSSNIWLAHDLGGALSRSGLSDPCQNTHAEWIEGQKSGDLQRDGEVICSPGIAIVDFVAAKVVSTTSGK